MAVRILVKNYHAELHDGACANEKFGWDLHYFA